VASDDALDRVEDKRGRFAVDVVAAAVAMVCPPSADRVLPLVLLSVAVSLK
jgi:hypothetical protein